MLEDESGRIRLIGKILEDTTLVTGVIVGVLGAETSNGDFEAIDLCFPGMAPQASEDDRMDTDGKHTVHANRRDFADRPTPDISGASTDSDSKTGNEYVAFISGLDIGSSPVSEAQTQVLVDYLAGACGDFDGQCNSSQISRLVVLGNSLAPLGQTGGVVNEEKEREDKKSVRHALHHIAFCLTPVVHSAGMGMTSRFHHIPFRTFLPTCMTCPNQWQSIFSLGNLILQERSFLNRPSHVPCSDRRPHLRPSPVKQIPRTSAFLLVLKGVTTMWI